MYGYIYKTTNLLNNYIYIGQKKSNIFLKNKYLGSGKILKNAIKKYGRENFTVELICKCYTQEELDDKEIYWIEYYRNLVGRDKCYNISGGGLTIRSWNKGLTNIYTKETLNKMSKAAKKTYE